jgi:hypothetical protein
MQQPKLNFTDAIIARYGFPRNAQISMKNPETLVFTVADSNECDELLDDRHLHAMVQVGLDLGTPYILVRRLDESRSPLMIRTRSLALLLERTS